MNPFARFAGESLGLLHAWPQLRLAAKLT